ncbi:MAG: prolyl oligopeptidase family serine peptidase [Vicinamibacterales bacterium]
MRKLIFVLAVVAAAGVVHARQAVPANGYLTPPKAIVDILDAEPLPTVSVSPDHKTMALYRRRSMPTIAEVAEPMLRLGGHRINPKINGPHLLRVTTSLTLKPIGGGADRSVALPAGANLLSMGFSPDGKRLAVGVVRPTGIEVWVVDTATAQAKALTGPILNATFSGGGPGFGGGGCDWLDSSAELLCSFVPAGRGPAPTPAPVPTGPNVQEHSGKAAPAATFQDLLETEYDERLFEYYFTSQLAYIDAATGRRTNVGRPGIMHRASPSSDGQYLLVARLKRPFSRLRPSNAFAKDVEVWSRAGQVVKKIADLPVAEDVPINGVETGPRSYRWHTTEPATVVWAEALDEGDPRKKVPNRDAIFALKAPFTSAPAEVVKTEMRFQNIAWTDTGVALVSEFERRGRRTRMWILDAGSTQPRKLWDRSSEDRYTDPGEPVTRLGLGRIIQSGEWIYTAGAGASPEGDRPFLDRVSLKTGASERLFRSDNQSYETVEALLSDDGKRILTEYQTKAEPPNTYVRDLNAGTRQALTTFKDPHPQITPSTMNRQFVTYKREDGVTLSGTIYVPAGQKPGQRLPMVVWAYPREFTNADAASQVVGSPNRFTSVSGASHLLLLTQGYAIFDGPTMPIVGDGETANDHYVDQLVSSAKAAIDKAVAMEIADRDRVGVGGHSYGAFMTANLLAHSDLFRAGIARSGAYNRTLTPFGFQNERRTFWEARDVYAKMSPFFFADKINEPILLIHGEADNNSGTFPIQTDRLYMALKGHGATVRYVTLPLESHGYSGRESVLHTVAEMLNWMNKWVKDARPRETTAASR